MNKKAQKFIIIGLIFIGISVLLLIYFNWENFYSSQKSFSTTKKLVKEIDTNKTNNDTIEIDGIEYIGYISIPALKILLPVTKNFSYSSLKFAPALYYGSITSKMVICGHSYKSHFGSLNKLQHGDKITFIDVKNKKYNYTVEEIEELAATDIKKMLESEFDLTIYTCTKDGFKRVTVRCNKVSAN